LTHGAGDIRVEPSNSPRFEDGDALAARIRTVPHVRGVVPMLIYAGAVGATSKRFLGTVIYGLPQTTMLPFHLAAGKMLAPGDDHGILLGTSLAQRLAVEVGANVEVRVVFGAAGLALDDNIGRYTMVVRGIVAGSGGAYRYAYVDRSFLAGEAGAPKAVSTLFVHLDDHEAATATAALIAGTIPGTEAIGWREDDPYIPNYLRANDTISSVSYAMVIAAVALPMWALLYIHVLKRRREIGILGALGFGRWEVFVIYVLQAVMVSLLGCALGALLGYGLICYFQANPLFQWETMVVRPVAAMWTFLGPALAISATAVIAGSYPAWRAARTDPAKVLRSLE
jgi:ABC-type lipoprotein release transport system permease subunit